MDDKQFKEIVKRVDKRTKLDKIMDCFIRPAMVGTTLVIIIESIAKNDLPSWLLVLLGTLLGMMIYSLIQLCYYSNDRIHLALGLEKDLALVEVIRDMDRRIKELEETKED